MPVPAAITDLSTTAASNSPAGSENVFPDLDNYLRALSAFIAENYANKAPKASPTFTGTVTIPTASVTGNATVGGTLGVTGATTLAGLTAQGTSVTTLSASSNATVGGTLGVTGAATLSSTLAVTGTGSVGAPTAARGNWHVAGAADTAILLTRKNAGADFGSWRMLADAADAYIIGTINDGYSAGNNAYQIGRTAGTLNVADHTWYVGASSIALTLTSASLASQVPITAQGNSVAQIYSGTTSTLTDYPVGTVLLAGRDGAAALARNATAGVKYSDTDATRFTIGGTGVALAGTWRARGGTTDLLLVQRVS